LFFDAHKHYKGARLPNGSWRQTNYEAAVSAFLRERLDFFLREARGFAYDVVNAVLAAGADDVTDALARAEAVSAARPEKDFEASRLRSSA